MVGRASVVAVARLRSALIRSAIVVASLRALGVVVVASAIGVLVVHGFALPFFGGIPTTARRTLRSRDSVDDLVNEVLLSEAGDSGYPELFCDVLKL